MYIIDSNIVIYSYLPEYAYLRNIFMSSNVFVSEISRVEVLGYHKLTTHEYSYFENVFNILPIIIPTLPIFDKAITLRRLYNLKLGDSIIAATALSNGAKIYTRDLSDFNRLKEIECINPIDKA